MGGLLSSIHDHLTGGTTKIDSGRLYQLINRAVELRLDVTAFADTMDRIQTIIHRSDPVLAAEFEKMNKMVESSLMDLQDRALDLASVRLKEITSTFPQLMRFVARKTGKEIRFEIVGEDIEIDRQILERLHEPMRHLLVNAIDHGIETPAERQAAGKPPTGVVALRVSQVANRLEVLVQDDGRGIDWEAVKAQGRALDVIDPEHEHDQSELARLLFLPGFSSKHGGNEVSGDGSGLASVAELAENLKGGLAVDSNPGLGTTISLTLPSTLAMQDVLLVEAEGQQWGVPATAVAASFPITSADIVASEDRIELAYRGKHIPIASFASAVGLAETEPVEHVLVLATRLGNFGLTVPRITARRQVAVKGISPLLGGVAHVTGAALLGAGRVVAILEPNRLIERVRSLPSPVSGRPRVLVVDDSTSVRQLVAAALSSHGFEVVVAAGSSPALKRLDAERFDAIVVDYQMPESDGVELVKQVRHNHPVMPIVMVSGVADPVDQDRAWSAGVSAYLDKFDLRQGALAQTLRSLLNLDVAMRATEKD
jgi:two-component system chemotaxis sensor kinase CheA